MLSTAGPRAPPLFFGTAIAAFGCVTNSEFIFVRWRASLQQQLMRYLDGYRALGVVESFGARDGFDSAIA
jgi:hypothetical protein